VRGKMERHGAGTCFIDREGEHDGQ
jgi:hypothetical protein